MAETKTKKKLSIKMTRGIAKATKHQLKILEALGIKKTGNVVQHDDGPTIMGMLNKVNHLVTIEENK